MLQGLKVVEFATYVAGPSAAMVMADWGAEVIKIERDPGDPTRRLFEARPELVGNPVFEFENRGKRGVALDVMQPSGREALLRILRDADVFITNLRARTLAKTRLDYAALKDELPRLVYCGISGYGSAGPDLPAFDIAAMWTRGGMGGVMIPEGVDPFPSRPGMGDAICALATASAVMAALIERGRTQRGRLVETSLIRAGVYAVGWDLSMQLKFGTTNAARPRHNALSALSNYYRTADDRWLCILSRSPEEWPRIADALNLAHLVADERFTTPTARVANAAQLIPILDSTFVKMTLAEALACLSARDIIAAPLLTAAEAVEDELARVAGCFVPVTDADGAEFLAPAAPADFPGAELGPKRPAPKLGQHTREVLAEVGYTAEEIEALIRSGAAQG